MNQHLVINFARFLASFYTRLTREHYIYWQWHLMCRKLLLHEFYIKNSKKSIKNNYRVLTHQDLRQECQIQCYFVNGLPSHQDLLCLLWSQRRVQLAPSNPSFDSNCSHFTNFLWPNQRLGKKKPLLNTSRTIVNRAKPSANVLPLLLSIIIRWRKFELSTTGDLASIKDPVSAELRSRIVYKTACSECNDNDTSKICLHLQTRVCKHLHELKISVPSPIQPVTVKSDKSISTATSNFHKMTRSKTRKLAHSSSQPKSPTRTTTSANFRGADKSSLTQPVKMKLR